jgi:hypothetical protein
VARRPELGAVNEVEPADNLVGELAPVAEGGRQFGLAQTLLLAWKVFVVGGETMKRRRIVLIAIIMPLSPLFVPGCGGDGSASRASEVGLGNPGECVCGPVTNSTVHQPLACFCDDPANSTSCPGAIADFALDPICQQSGGAIRVMGCGKVSMITTGSYAGSSPTFDAQTGRLVGVYMFSDIVFGSCTAHAYIYGQTLLPADAAVAGAQDACSAISYCTVCGPSSDAYPPCT